MSSEIQPIGDFDRVEHVLLRMRDAVAAKNDSALAAFMGISPKTVSNWKQRGSIPGEYTSDFCARTGTSLDWIVLGREAEQPYGPNPRATRLVTGEPNHEGEFVELPWYDAKASAGLGIENHGGHRSKDFWFRRDWWVKHIGVAPENCFSMELVGDSMEPRLTAAHLPIIQWCEEMLGEGIYVFRLDGEVYVKNLERIPGRGVVARSENPKYTPWEIGDGSAFSEFKIIGRVLKKQLVMDP